MIPTPKAFLMILVVSIIGTLAAAGERSMPKGASVPPLAMSRDGVPALRVREPVFTFNATPQSLEVAHDFKVENIGTAILRIDDVAPD